MRQHQTFNMPSTASTRHETITETLITTPAREFPTSDPEFLRLLSSNDPGRNKLALLLSKLQQESRPVGPFAAWLPWDPPPPLVVLTAPQAVSSSTESESLKTF